MSLLERVYYFHDELSRNRYPNARSLVEQFEISTATARRDIAYLRDRMLAPLAFSSKKNGFYYTEEGFTLPFENSPKITYLLGMLSKLAEEAGLKGLQEVKQLEERLGTMLFKEHQRLVDALHCEWIEVEDITPQTFETIIEALIKSQRLHIKYKADRKTRSDRIIEPLRLINYQGRWYLAAFCTLRKAIRMFHIARIERVTLQKDRNNPHHKLPKDYLEESFGIFKGKSRYLAKVLFMGKAADLIMHQHWHKKQTITETEDGVILTLPVNDDREITMKVLQYGSKAKVLYPEELKEKIAEEIAAMNEIY